MGTYPDATAVFNVDAIGLCNLANMLNHGYDLGRNLVGRPTEFCFGVALNPSAVNLDRESERFHWKREAGAEFAITQPVFDAGPLLRFIDRLGGSIGFLSTPGAGTTFYFDLDARPQAAHRNAKARGAAQKT